MAGNVQQKPGGTSNQGQVHQSVKRSSRGCLAISLLLLIASLSIAIFAFFWLWNNWGLSWTDISRADKSLKATLIFSMIGVVVGIMGVIINSLPALVAVDQLFHLLPDDVIPTILSRFQQLFYKIGQLLKIKQLMQLVVSVVQTIIARFNKKQFLISFHLSDRLWAEWIAQQLEDNKYSTIMQDWDGGNLVQEIHKMKRKAKYTIAVLSPHYIDHLKNESLHHFKKWNGKRSISVQVHESKYQGLLPPGRLINLADIDKVTACERLLNGLPLRPDPKHRPESRARSPFFPGAFPLIYNAPFDKRNKLFTDRDTFLEDLHRKFSTGRADGLVKSQAIRGLSGMGKTETALEYAYRYRRSYQTILWIEASPSEFELSCKKALLVLKEAVDAAPLLKEDIEADPINSLKSWLSNNSDWLLILNHCRDLKPMEDFIPLDAQGHILLTTRVQAMPKWTSSPELCGLEADDGALFLLRRAGILKADDRLDKASQTDIAKAREISEKMDGLPLGLELAGAYVNEVKESLSNYLDFYNDEKRRAELLRKHPQYGPAEFEAIATIWSISFREIRQNNLAAAYLLQFCAFLEPHPIPEEIIVNAPELGRTLQSVVANPLAFDDAITELRNFSLVDRDRNLKTLIVHPLVQAVIKEGVYENKGIDPGMKHTWAERVVRAVNHVFPEVDFANWQLCQRYLPHAQACAGLIKQWDIKSAEAARLLDQAGVYLRERGRYEEAEPFIERALNIRLNNPGWGQDHLDVAVSLNNLAELYRLQGKYAKAEPLYLQALRIRQQKLGPEDLQVAASLNNLASLYDEWGKFSDVEPLYQQALNIREKVLGPKHPDVAVSLSNLAGVYYRQGEALRIQGEDARKQGDRNLARDLYNQARGEFAKAEPLYKRALDIFKGTLGLAYPSTAQSLANMATLYLAQGKRVDAEAGYKEALEISKQTLGLDHPQVAHRLNNLAELYRRLRKYDLAEPLYQEAIAIYEQKLGDHPALVNTLKNYATLLEEKGYRDEWRKEEKLTEAQRLRRRAREILVRHAHENPS